MMDHLLDAAGWMPIANENQRELPPKNASE
jgi:hypothetical protein